jgi:SAM-dependent methyltransferase
MQNDGHQYHGSYERQAMYYDAIYESQGKDYKKESEQIYGVIEKHKKTSGKRILDVGCGTGGHFSYLKDWYSVEGLDIDENMLGVARNRFPDVLFHLGSMVDFHLNDQFDAITCLFSAIGYTKTVEAMRQSVATMARHLIKGGVLVVEPWFAPDQWNVGVVHSAFVDKPDLKIARINVSERDGNISIINFHFLVGSEGKVEHFTERHELGLFTVDEYTQAFKDAGLETIVDRDGITGRGLYIGVKL